MILEEYTGVQVDVRRLKKARLLDKNQGESGKEGTRLFGSGGRELGH